MQTLGRGTGSSEFALRCIVFAACPVLLRPACPPASPGPAPSRVCATSFQAGSAFRSSLTQTRSHAPTLSIWPAASHAWLQRGPVLPGAAVGQEARGSGAGAQVGTAGGSARPQCQCAHSVLVVGCVVCVLCAGEAAPCTISLAASQPARRFPADYPSSPFFLRVVRPRMAAYSGAPPAATCWLGLRVLRVPRAGVGLPRLVWNSVPPTTCTAPLFPPTKGM